MGRFLLATAIAAGIGSPANAGQPIHESLVECAVLVELLLGEQSFVPGDNAVIDLYVGAASAMRKEAVSRTSEAYAFDTAGRKREIWHERWDTGGWDDPAKRGELIEWWTYCFKLADHLDLKL